MGGMNNSLFYIKVTCVKNLVAPNITFNIGDVFYFNSKAQGDDMYVFYSYSDKRHLSNEEHEFYRKLIGIKTHIPFTKQKRFAKKWQRKSYAEYEKDLLEQSMSQYFTFDIIEIKVTYTEE